MTGSRALVHRWGLPVVSALCLAALSACDGPEPPSARFQVAKVLSGTDKGGFETADRIISLEFPRDHGPHPRFRNEWWYLTGNLADSEGRRYGYQITFFRIGLSPPSVTPPQDSGWAYRELWMAHAALTDVRAGKHRHEERFSRGNPGMAGARAEPFRVWLDNWRLESGTGEFPWLARVETDAYELELNLTAVKPMVLQGDQGLSRKSERPGNASYYYSYPRLEAAGILRVDGELRGVAGLSWFDREWSTSALDDDQVGWDWFSLQFEDGTELMYYQLRDTSGRPHPGSQGKWIDADGNASTISPQDIALQVKRRWQAPDGSAYPVEWRLHYRDRGAPWVVRALLEDQLMEATVSYWEGAVEVLDADTGQLLGRGYLEMTGY